MNRLSITRKLGAYALRHPRLLESPIMKYFARTLPKGYRKIVGK